MATKRKNLSENHAAEMPDATGWKIGVVVADWNPGITTALHRACHDTLIQYGVAETDIHIARVPGSYELPMGARILDGRHSLDAIVCLGCVIRGETSHNEYINQSVANGLMQLSIMRNKPFVFGLLTPNNMEQAEDRAGGKHGNKGVEAAITALRMIALQKENNRSEKVIGFK